MLILTERNDKKTIMRVLFFVFLMMFGQSKLAHADEYFYPSSSFHISTGLAERTKNENIVTFSLQYSEPSIFFSLPARSNVELYYNMANKGTIQAYNNLVTGLAEDVDLLRMSDIYAGVGMGIYIENRLQDMTNYQIVFGHKFYLGYQFSKSANIEFFWKNFQKNRLMVRNSAFKVMGLSFILNFD